MPRIHVAVGVIVGSDGRILLSRRPAHVHQGGKWEFPGGKVEPGETVAEALSRELWEELGIIPVDARPLIQIPWRYPDLDVFLDVWRVERFEGKPSGREGQQLDWCEAGRLAERDFPAANKPIVAAASLPAQIVITPENAQLEAGFEQRLARLAAAGRRIHLRLPGLAPEAYSALLDRLRQRNPGLMAQLVLTSTADEVSRVGAAGLHLSARRMMALKDPLPGDIAVSVSCHSAEELRQAEAIGAHYAFLSPVMATKTHPEAAPLGWERFAGWVRDSIVPVYALGGMDSTCLADAWQHGAQGIAAIRGLWQLPG